MRKLYGLRRRTKNNSGIILLVVLWSLVIIAIMALTLARGTQMELAMARNAIGKVQSHYIAWAGVMFAVEHIRKDTESDESKDFDTLYLCGISQDGISILQDRFKEIEVGNGTFSIRYNEYNSSVEKEELFYGLKDLERNINLNTLSIQTAPILSSLLALLGVDVKTADEIAYSVVDWTDANDILSHSEYGAENDYYEEATPSYAVKNKPFDSLDELRLVRGVTDQIFEKMRVFVALFPRQGSFKVNFDTAPRIVLLAMAKSVSGSMTNTEIADAESLVEKIIIHRNGDDQISATEDDREIDLNSMMLNLKERTIFLALNGYRIRKSNYFNAQVKSKTETHGVVSMINAVIQREDLSIVAWKRQ